MLAFFLRKSCSWFLDTIGISFSLLTFARIHALLPWMVLNDQRQDFSQIEL